MKTFFVAAALTIAAPAFAHEIIHAEHSAVHSATDGHIAIAHHGHVDHLHGNHLHSLHGAHVDEHIIAVSARNPIAEEIVATADDEGHRHTADGTHARVQHGDHFDYLHGEHLHFVHGDHVDDHGTVKLVK